MGDKNEDSNAGIKGVAKALQLIQSGNTGISTVDKQKKADAVMMAKLKRGSKSPKVSVKAETFDITPKAGGAFDINKNTIFQAKFGGEAMKLTPKQKKLDKNKDGKISGDDFAMMEDGGEANNKKNKSQSFNQSKGIYGIKNWKENTKNSREKLNSDRIARGDKRNPVKALARMIDDEFEVSDPSMYDEIHIDGAVYSSKNRTPEKSYKPQNPKKVGPKKMEMGGKVEEYGHGGSVKGGGMSCRGMGAAIKGGGFKIR